MPTAIERVRSEAPAAKRAERRPAAVAPAETAAQEESRAEMSVVSPDFRNEYGIPRFNMRTTSLLALQVFVGGMLGVASTDLWTPSNDIASRIINFVAISPTLSLPSLVVESALGVRARSLGAWIIAGILTSIAQTVSLVIAWWLGGGSLTTQLIGPNLAAGSLLGPLAGLLACRLSRYLDAKTAAATRHRPARFRRPVIWASLSALAVATGIWIASLACNFAVRAGICSLMVNSGVLEVETLGVWSYGWTYKVFPRSTYLTWGDELLRIPLALLWLILLAIATWAWRRGRYLPRGHCANCGYDLAGNVSGRCPECGAPREDWQGGVNEGATG